MPQTRQHREYTTSSVVLSFARFGVSIGTISRALTVPTDHVELICRRAVERGDVHMMPPAEPGSDASRAALAELAHLRNSVSDLQQQVRTLSSETSDGWLSFWHVAGMTESEAKFINALAVHGRVSKARLYFAIYGDVLDAPEPKIIDVFKCKAQAKLRRRGIEIGTIWGHGYEMTPANRDRLRILAGLPVVDSPALCPAANAEAA